MKRLALVLVLTLRLHSSGVHADEEIKKKFVEELTPISKECNDLHQLKEEDIKAIRSFEIPPNEEGKCFVGCIYSKLGMINGSEFNPTPFKEKLQDWLQKYPEKYQKTEAMLNTCKEKVKEANPKGGNECVLVSSIMQCFQSHQEETESFKKFLASINGSEAGNK